MSFTRMDQGTVADWKTILADSSPYDRDFPDRILAMLRALQGLEGGFAVDQLAHALQTASRAERAGANDELVLAALCHDVGKAISLKNHASIGAEILRPWVSTDVYRILATHQDFQGRYYYSFLKGDIDPSLRLRHRDEAWFSRAEQFCDEWDQVSFDPAYESLPLSHFEPLVRRILGVKKAPSIREP